MTWTAQGEALTYSEEETAALGWILEYAQVASQSISGWLWDLEFGLVLNSERENNESIRTSNSDRCN